MALALIASFSCYTIPPTLVGGCSLKDRIFNWIGTTYKVLGDYDNSLIFLKKELEIEQKIGDRAGEGTTLNNISQLYAAKGDYETALDLFTTVP